MSPSSGGERAWMRKVWRSPLQIYTLKAYTTWNLKNYDFKKYNFFFWGDKFSRSDVGFCGVYHIISVSINLAALPPNLQGGATVKEKHTETAWVNKVLHCKTQAKLSSGWSWKLKLCPARLRGEVREIASNFRQHNGCWNRLCVV